MLLHAGIEECHKWGMRVLLAALGLRAGSSPFPEGQWSRASPQLLQFLLLEVISIPKAASVAKSGAPSLAIIAMNCKGIGAYLEFHILIVQAVLIVPEGTDAFFGEIPCSFMLPISSIVDIPTFP